MNLNLIVLFNMLENVAIVAGTTICAIHFERPAILAWYILVLFNSYSFNRQ